MKTLTMDKQLLETIAATRAMLGAGIGLLLADRLTAKKRKQFGWTLLSIGALSTIPILLKVFRDGSHNMPAEKSDLEHTTAEN